MDYKSPKSYKSVYEELREARQERISEYLVIANPPPDCFISVGDFSFPMRIQILKKHAVVGGPVHQMCENPGMHRLDLSGENAMAVACVLHWLCYDELLVKLADLDRRDDVLDKFAAAAYEGSGSWDSIWTSWLYPPEEVDVDHVSLRELDLHLLVHNYGFSSVLAGVSLHLVEGLRKSSRSTLGHALKLVKNKPLSPGLKNVLAEGLARKFDDFDPAWFEQILHRNPGLTMPIMKYMRKHCHED